MALEDEQNRRSEGKTAAREGMFPPHYAARWLMLAVGLVVMAMGVAFSIKSNLGTSPISSFPYVLSVISPLSVGTATIAMHVVLILLQILILRRRYQPIQLLQLVVAILFGYLTDFCIWLISGLTYSNYLQQWVYCVIGVLLVAVGVSMEVVAKAVTLAGEGFILAVCKVTPMKFGTMKVVFDVSLVVLACITSLVFLHTITGVREGTVAAAICVGLLSRQIQKPMVKFEQKFLM